MHPYTRSVIRDAILAVTLCAIAAVGVGTMSEPPRAPRLRGFVEAEVILDRNRAARHMVLTSDTIVVCSAFDVEQRVLRETAPAIERFVRTRFGSSYDLSVRWRASQANVSASAGRRSAIAQPPPMRFTVALGYVPDTTECI